MSRRRRVREWARRYNRQQRLVGAVLACLGVMIGLVIALNLTIGWLSNRSDANLDAAAEWSAASVDANQLSAELRSWQATAEQEQDIARRLDALMSRVAALDPDLTYEATVSFDDVAERLLRFLDLRGSLQRDFIGNMRAEAPIMAELSSSFGLVSVAQNDVAVARLDDWFAGIRVVSIVAAIVFALVVATQILPLARSIDRSMSKLRDWNDAAATETRRRSLSHQVVDGLEVATDESAALVVIERSLRVAAPDGRAEMLLADSSKAHLRAKVVHPDNGGAGCAVSSPWACPAVRRGSTQIFDDSTAIRACPHLSRHSEPCSAVCAPMTFMGEPMGVLHVTGPVGDTPSDELVVATSMVASESANRIGTLRAFAKAELQAATDVLTGLPNRRATEAKMREILSQVEGGSAAMIELIGISKLNNVAGKAEGDRALTVAADALAAATRDSDWCGRWGGAEFVAVLPGASATVARRMVDRIRTDMMTALQQAGFDGLDALVGVADTRRATTAHAMMSIMSSAISGDRDGAAPDLEESGENLPDPQLSTP